MKIKNFYTLEEAAKKKRRRGVWFFLLFLVLLCLGGFYLLTLVLIPKSEPQPQDFVNSQWDGYACLDISADPPNGPDLVRTFLGMSMAAAGGDLDPSQVERIQNIVLYPRIHTFIHYDSTNDEEQFLMVFALKRLPTIIQKALEQSFPQIHPWSSGIKPEDSPSGLFRDLTKNELFLTNNPAFIQSIHNNDALLEAPGNDTTGAEPQASSFEEKFNALPQEALLKGFFLNRNGNLKALAQQLQVNDDVYYCVAEPFDMYYKEFWNDADWLDFQVNVEEPSLMTCRLDFKMNNRLQSVKLENFLRDNYFPRIVKFLEGRILSDINVSRDEYVVTATFKARINFLNYLFDSGS